MITFIKDDAMKLVDEESSLILTLLEQGWNELKPVTEIKEVKNANTSTTIKK